MAKWLVKGLEIVKGMPMRCGVLKDERNKYLGTNCAVREGCLAFV